MSECDFCERSFGVYDVGYIGLQVTAVDDDSLISIRYLFCSDGCRDLFKQDPDHRAFSFVNIGKISENRRTDSGSTTIPR